MSGGFFRSAAHASPSHETDEDRWIISYADFITLLFAFFVVMYSISSVNDGKFRVLSDSLTLVFNDRPEGAADVNSAVPVDLGGRTIETLRNASELDAMAEERQADLLKDIEPVTVDPDATVAERIEQAMEPLIEDLDVRVREGQQWVEVELPSELLFASGEMRINPRAVPVIQRMAASLAGVTSPIRVEGFTDDVPFRGQLVSSNWQLSAIRAAAVVDEFTQSGIDPALLSAVGFGEFHPVAGNDTEEGRRKNRRVVVAIAKHADLVGGKPISRSYRDGIADELMLNSLRRITKLPGYIGLF